MPCSTRNWTSQVSCLIDRARHVALHPLATRQDKIGRQPMPLSYTRSIPFGGGKKDLWKKI